MNLLEIDWSTEEDRRRRRYKPSTIHGWLRMWRGTLAGNERVRQQGRYEMKEARAMRAHQRRRQAAGGDSGPFSIFRIGSFNNKQAASPTPQRQKSSGSKRHHRSGSQSQHNTPRSTKRKGSSSGANSGHHNTRHGHGHARPEPSRQRSSHSAKGRTRPSRQSSGRR